MSASFPVADRIEFGLRYEPLLLPIIQNYLQDRIMKTSYCFSLLDFVGIFTWSELKVRSSQYHYTDECMKDGWLIPACKILKAWQEDSAKTVFFFYLWEKDGSLWSMKFDSHYFTTLVPRIPSYHQDKQLHYYVPSEKWTKIADLKIDELKPSAGCLIQDV